MAVLRPLRPVVTTPVAPTSLTASSSPGVISLMWTDNSNNETGFEVWRRVGLGGVYALLATVAPNQTVYTDFDLVDGVEHFYQVRGVRDEFTIYLPGEFSNEDSAIAQAVTITQPVWVQSAGNGVNSGALITATFQQLPVAGNLLIAAGGCDQTTAGGIVGGGWTRLSTASVTQPVFTMVNGTQAFTDYETTTGRPHTLFAKVSDGTEIQVQMEFGTNAEMTLVVVEMETANNAFPFIGDAGFHSSRDANVNPAPYSSIFAQNKQLAVATEHVLSNTAGNSTRSFDSGFTKTGDYGSTNNDYAIADARKSINADETINLNTTLNAGSRTRRSGIVATYNPDGYVRGDTSGLSVVQDGINTAGDATFGSNLVEITATEGWSTATVGNKIYAILTTQNNAFNTTPTMSPGSWTLEASDPTSSGRVWVFSKTSDGTETFVRAARSVGDVTSGPLILSAFEVSGLTGNVQYLQAIGQTNSGFGFSVPGFKADQGKGVALAQLASYGTDTERFDSTVTVALGADKGAVTGIGAATVDAWSGVNSTIICADGEFVGAGVSHTSATVRGAIGYGTVIYVT